MHWDTLISIWHRGGQKNGLKVRFLDWNHTIKYFMITGESEDGKRLVGKLDNGESMSFAKFSRGWGLYGEGAEQAAKAV
ncbi:MAG: hypothetical protein K2P81_08680 [Bacteriovoracaceae bacterium]|nr:hypothetical protein [Bacteriovoracaceae bacterium]